MSTFAQIRFDDDGLRQFTMITDSCERGQCFFCSSGSGFGSSASLVFSRSGGRIFAGFLGADGGFSLNACRSGFVRVKVEGVANCGVLDSN